MKKHGRLWLVVKLVMLGWPDGLVDVAHFWLAVDEGLTRLRIRVCFDCGVYSGAVLDGGPEGCRGFCWRAGMKKHGRLWLVVKLLMLRL